MGESGTQPVVLAGHVIDVLRTLPPDSIQCVVCSPPYWGQRSYGTEWQVWGGDASHEHQWVETSPRRPRSTKDEGHNSAYKKPHMARTDDRRAGGMAGAASPANYDALPSESCACGAWKGELGQEPTPGLFVDHLATVFDEVRRIIKENGTLWVNLGGTYATSPSGNRPDRRWEHSAIKGNDRSGAEASGAFDKRAPGWKRKEYVPVPWLFGLEMHRRGWWIRSDVQWWKLNGKHENVEDRPFRAHEYVTMYSKGPDPLYNEPDVRQPYAPDTLREIGVAYRGMSKRARVVGLGDVSLYERAGAQDPSDLKRRIIESLIERGGSMLPDVWFLAVGNGEGEHVAVFPETLPELCITASSNRGDTVLDPFAGSGTTLAVARRLGRPSIGTELNPNHVLTAKEKCRAAVPDLNAWTEPVEAGAK